MLPKYTVPSRLDVRFSGVTPVSAIVTSVRFCARPTGANEISVATATIALRTIRALVPMLKSLVDFAIHW